MKIAAVFRSLVMLFAALFAVTLPAAAAPAPAPALLGVPVLIVYPFSANGGDITREAGSELAVTIATQIANLGGVTVKPAPPGVERQSFLDQAQRAGADYYVAGYMTPLGDGVSVVEQLVSTSTGIVVYSNSAQVRTLVDATGQGDVLRDALLRHQARNLGAYTAPPPPAAAPSPTPGTAREANIGRLFGHKRPKAAAATPVAVAVTPHGTSATVAASIAPSPLPPAAAVASGNRASGYALLAIGGTAADERRSFAVAALRNDILAKHQPVHDSVVTRDSACRTNDIGTLVGGNLATSNHTILGQPQTTATLDLVAYDCTGNVVYRRTFAHGAHGGWKDAVNGVVASAVEALLHGSSPVRRG